MVRWHHQFNGHDLGQTPGDGEGQGSLAPWVVKLLSIYQDTTECYYVLLICTFKRNLHQMMGFSGGSDGKESACNVGDPGSVSGSGRSPGEGNDATWAWFLF